MIANTAIASLGANRGAIDQLKAQQAGVAQVPTQQSGSQIEELSSRVGMLESNNQDASMSQGGLGIPGEIPQQTIDLPTPSNQMGTARPVFDERSIAKANDFFSPNPQVGLGDNAPMFDVNNNKYNNQQLT